MAATTPVKPRPTATQKADSQAARRREISSAPRWNTTRSSARSATRAATSRPHGPRNNVHWAKILQLIVDRSAAGLSRHTVAWPAPPGSIWSRTDDDARAGILPLGARTVPGARLGHSASPVDSGHVQEQEGPQRFEEAEPRPEVRGPTPGGTQEALIGLCDVGPRDGLQNEKALLEVDRRGADPPPGGRRRCARMEVAQLRQPQARAADGRRRGDHGRPAPRRGRRSPHRPGAERARPGPLPGRRAATRPTSLVCATDGFGIRNQGARPRQPRGPRPHHRRGAAAGRPATVTVVLLRLPLRRRGRSRLVA